MKRLGLLFFIVVLQIGAFSQSHAEKINDYLKETRILNYSDSLIQNLVDSRGWKTMGPIEKIRSIYNYVRDDILFGYNTSDSIQASRVLMDGYGQCNTKATLLMALLRAVDIPNRIHGFTIDKALQKGAIDGIWYRLAPDNILHSWVEVYVNGKWYFLEGVILDKKYLEQLQQKYSSTKKEFCGYGVYTDNFLNPPIDWNLNNTYIQEKGINQDFGLFDSPDDYYQIHMQELGRLKRFVFRKIVRKRMNKNVNRIRSKS